MSTLLEIVSDGSLTGGWTARLGPFTARVDGVGISLTGMTCTAQIRGKNQSSYIDAAGDVTLGNQTTNPGQWYLDPDVADFSYVLSPYTIRLMAVDGAGKRAYFGSSVEPDLVAVGRP